MTLIEAVPTSYRLFSKYVIFKGEWRSQRDLSCTLKSLALSPLKYLISLLFDLFSIALTHCSHLQTKANPRRAKHTTGPKKDRLLGRDFIVPKSDLKIIAQVQIHTKLFFITDFIMGVHHG